MIKLTEQEKLLFGVDFNTRFDPKSNDDGNLGMVRTAQDLLTIFIPDGQGGYTIQEPDRPLFYYWRGLWGGGIKSYRKKIPEFTKAFNENIYTRLLNKKSKITTAMKKKILENSALTQKELDEIIKEGKVTSSMIEDAKQEGAGRIRTIRFSIFGVRDNLIKLVERTDFQEFLERKKEPTNTLAVTILKVLREVTEYLFFAYDVDRSLNVHIVNWYEYNMPDILKKKPDYFYYDGQEWHFRKYRTLENIIRQYETAGLRQALQGWVTLKEYYNYQNNITSEFWDLLANYIYHIEVPNWNFDWDKVVQYIGLAVAGFSAAEMIIQLFKRNK